EDVVESRRERLVDRAEDHSGGRLDAEACDLVVVELVGGRGGQVFLGDEQAGAGGRRGGAAIPHTLGRPEEHAPPPPPPRAPRPGGAGAASVAGRRPPARGGPARRPGAGLGAGGW